MTAIATRSNLFQIALLELGTTEIGATNDNKYGREFGFNKVAWCMIFVSIMFLRIGKTLQNGGWTKGFASVPLFLEKFKMKAVIDPRLMDCVIYDWDKVKGVDHVGFFICWIDKQAGTFLSLEGNTSYANQSNGGEVMMRIRNMKDVTAFIDPFNLPL